VIDINALIGPYPFRLVPHPEPGVLVRVMDREGIQRSWVGHLPSAFHRDPSAGNAELYSALKPHDARLIPERERCARIRRSGNSVRMMRECVSWRSPAGRRSCRSC
jgi:hypothetical protein